jgi:hypothetical protein
VKVNIKQLGLNMELKTKGMELAVYNAKNKHLGDLFINKANLIWCPGKSTPKSGGIAMSWGDFISEMEKK